MTDLASSPELRAHAIPVHGQLRRSRRLWRVLSFVLLALLAVALFGRFALPEVTTADRIARIRINGTIASDPNRVAVLKALGEDPSVRAVVVSINSPGGTTAGGEELYEALGALRAEKPVVAVIDELGASAAYMTAIAADRIFVRRLSIVGSIGVLYQHVDAGKLLRTVGIDLDKVASGPLKAEPDFDEGIDPAVRESLEALITDSFAWFVDIVAERRNLSAWQTRSLADGRIVTGRQGIELGLVDAIGGEAEAVDWLVLERDVPADLPVHTSFPLPDEGFDWLGQLLGSGARSALGLQQDGPIILDGLVSLWQVGPSL